MRTTQFVGFTRKAEDFLGFECKCLRHYDVVEGMFNEKVCDLCQYETPDGQVVESYVQAEPWASGPVIFLSIRDAETKEPLSEYEWTDL